MKRPNSTPSWRSVLAGMLLGAGVLGLPAVTGAQGAREVKKAQADSFFIISSVDAKKQQMVLKLPTEVTEVVQVTPETVYRDEQGRALKFDDLHAGDTVYARLRKDAKGDLVVVSIRRGPMTTEELHRRYLSEE